MGIDTGGQVELLPDDQLAQELVYTTARIKQLEKEKERRATFTASERLADQLHQLLHYKIDCDYVYSQWDNPKGCRVEFHQLAQRLQDWWTEVALTGNKASHQDAREASLNKLLVILNRK